MMKHLQLFNTMRRFIFISFLFGLVIQGVQAQEEAPSDAEFESALEAVRAAYEESEKVKEAFKEISKARDAAALEELVDKPMPEWMLPLVKRIESICSLNLLSDKRGSCDFRISPSSGIAHLKTVQHVKEGPYRKYQSINLWNVYDFEVREVYQSERKFLWLRCLDGPGCEDWDIYHPTEKPPKRFGFYVKTRKEAGEIEATIRQIRDRLERACPPKRELESRIQRVTEKIDSEWMKKFPLTHYPENYKLRVDGKKKLAFLNARIAAFKEKRTFLQSCAERE